MVSLYWYTDLGLGAKAAQDLNAQTSGNQAKLDLPEDCDPRDTWELLYNSYGIRSTIGPSLTQLWVVVVEEYPHAVKVVGPFRAEATAEAYIVRHRIRDSEQGLWARPLQVQPPTGVAVNSVLQRLLQNRDKRSRDSEIPVMGLCVPS